MKRLQKIRDEKKRVVGKIEKGKRQRTDHLHRPAESSAIEAATCCGIGQGCEYILPRDSPVQFRPREE